MNVCVHIRIAHEEIVRIIRSALIKYVHRIHANHERQFGRTRLFAPRRRRQPLVWIATQNALIRHRVQIATIPENQSIKNKQPLNDAVQQVVVKSLTSGKSGPKIPNSIRLIVLWN